MITHDEWMKAFEDAHGPTLPLDDSAKTTNELAALWGVSPSTARRYITDLVAHGRAEEVRKMVTRAGQRAYPTPAYRLKEKTNA